MMKLKILLIFTLLIGVSALGQPVVVLKAFKQHVIPGTVPKRISDDAPGSGVVEKYASTNYYLYLIYPKTVALQPQLVWINKKAYTINTEAVTETPVKHTSRMIPTQPVTRVLVDKTSNKVVRLVPVSPADNATPTACAKKLMETSELVVTYKWKGKTYHKAVKKISELDPQMME